MWRMAGRPLPSIPHAFTDITAVWQQDAVSWMAEQHITTGTTPTTFSPNDPLTRGQLAALLWRLAGQPSTSGAVFPDVIAVWQLAPVAWMVAQHITTGTTPTTFSPDAAVSRAQLAAFFYRYSGNPAVAINPAHPTIPGCTNQAPSPTTTTTTTVPKPGFGPGTYVVGTDIAPGIYRANPASGCYWERLSGFGGSIGEIIANDFYSGVFRSALVSIAPSDVGFSPNSKCGFWTSDLSPVTASPTADFGGGQYIVGTDIAPGTWRATGGSGCYWERRRGHGGTLSEIIANDFTNTPPIVAIAAADVGFHADPDCGTWTKIG